MVDCGGAWSLADRSLLFPAWPGPFRLRTGDSLLSHNTGVIPRSSPVHALLPAKPVSRFPLHLTVQAEFLLHAWRYVDVARRCATDGTAPVLPHGRSQRRADVPWGRSVTENAAMQVFPDRTIASHQPTKVMVVV